MPVQLKDIRGCFDNGIKILQSTILFRYFTEFSEKPYFFNRFLN